MKLRVQVVIEAEDGTPEIVAEVACLERGALQPETLGLTLAEAKERHVTAVAELLDDELRAIEPAIAGCPADLERLPDPDGPLTVRLDGGDVPARRGECPQATAFEAIIGKSVTAAGVATRFGFVDSGDAQPRRRLVAVLQAQGMQMNQQITFLSDGGDNVRDLPLYLNPQAEHILDWFHLTMRLTTMGQMAKGVRSADDPTLATDLQETLERLKWYLWHGNVFRALQLTDDLTWDLEAMEARSEARKLLKTVREFETYIRVNRAFIPNYGERYRYGETISTAFVESTVNQVLSKRMAKKQQMRWTRRGAHRLLQVRTRVLDGALRGVFRQWYPAMESEDRAIPQAA